jgi:uncharacterized protein Usg
MHFARFSLECLERYPSHASGMAAFAIVKAKIVPTMPDLKKMADFWEKSRI